MGHTQKRHPHGHTRKKSSSRTDSQKVTRTHGPAKKSPASSNHRKIHPHTRTANRIKNFEPVENLNFGENVEQVKNVEPVEKMKTVENVDLENFDPHARTRKILTRLPTPANLTCTRKIEHS